MAVDKNIYYQIKASGASQVIGSMKGIEKEGKAIAKTMAKDFAMMGAAFGSAMTAAWKNIEKSIEKFNDWDKELRKIQGSLGLTNSQTNQLSAQMQQLGRGELASIPGVFEHLGEATRDYLESGGDLAHLNEDIGNAFKFAQVNGEDYGDTVAQLMSITDAYNIANGESEETLQKLKTAQLNTNKPIAELVKGLEKGSGVANAMNMEFDQMVALTAGWASTGERATTMSTALVAIMDEFNLTSFPELIELLERANKGQVDFSNLSQQNKRYLGALSQQVDQVRSTYSDLQQESTYLNDSFKLFAESTLAETTRAQNELQAEMLKTGERMQELQPTIENFKMKIQLGMMQMAEWALKNPEYVAAIIAGIMTLKTAFMALKASNPVGWIIAAVEGLVGLGLFLSDILVQTQEETLEAVRANKQMLESQKADIDATREQIKAKEGLTDQYKRLTEQSFEYERSIRELSVAEHQLERAIAARNAANEIGTEAYEATIENALNLAAQQVKTEEDRLRIQEAITQATYDSAEAQGDENKLNETAVKLMANLLGEKEENVEYMMEDIDSQEEINSLLDYAQSVLSESNNLQDQAQGMVSATTREYLAINGILEDIKNLNEDNLDLTEKEARAAWDRAAAAITQLQAEKGRLEAIHGDANLMAQVEKRVDAVNQSIAEAQALLRTAGSVMGGAAEGPWDWEDQEEDITGGGAGGGSGVPESEQERIRARTQFELELQKDKEQQLNDLRLSLDDAFNKRTTDRKFNLLKTEYDFAKELDEERIAQLRKGYGALASMFVGIIRGGGVEALKQWVDSLATQLMQNAIVWALLKMFNPSAAGDFVSQLFGGTFLGDIFGFAEGGYVDQPTPGIFGEAGGEFLVPEKLVQQRIQEHGIAGAMMALQEVSGKKMDPGSINVSPQVQVPQPQMIPVIDADGLYMLVKYGEKNQEVRRGY
jgi:hypothetical protein